MFSSLLVFPRLPYIAMNLSTQIPLHKELELHDFVLHGVLKEKLLSSYVVLVSRILAGSRKYSWMAKYVTRHIAHEYEDYMALKSTVIPLTIIDKNEAKYEDCLDICDNYEETMVGLHRQVFGKLICKILSSRFIDKHIFDNIIMICHHILNVILK